MIADIPPFNFGTHYEELYPSAGARYRYRSDEDTTVILANGTGIHAEFKDANGRTWMIIDGNKIIVKRGYAWNGCSPKWVMFGRWCGTPDYPETILASMVHDALVQFFLTNHNPYSKVEVDLIFYHLMMHKNFKFANQYHYAVQKFGNYTKKNGEYSIPLN